MMEKSQGGSSILSLQVTTAAWFNETVCQKAKQQPVNKQAEVTHTQVSAQLNRMQTDCQKVSFLSSSCIAHTHTQKHMFTKVLAGLYTGKKEDGNFSVWAHWEKAGPSHQAKRWMLVMCSLHQATEAAYKGQLIIQRNTAVLKCTAAAWNLTQTSVIKGSQSIKQIKQKIRWMMGPKSKAHYMWHCIKSSHKPGCSLICTPLKADSCPPPTEWATAITSTWQSGLSLHFISGISRTETSD